MLTRSVGSTDMWDVVVPQETLRASRSVSRSIPESDPPKTNLVQGDPLAEGESLLQTIRQMEPADMTISEETTTQSSTLASATEDVRGQAEERFARIVEQINEKLGENLSLRFRKDEDTGINYFQIIEKKTGDIIRQYPPDEMLELVANLRDLQGLLISKQA